MGTPKTEVPMRLRGRNNNVINQKGFVEISNHQAKREEYRN